MNLEAIYTVSRELKEELEELREILVSIISSRPTYLDLSSLVNDYGVYITDINNKVKEIERGVNWDNFMVEEIKKDLIELTALYSIVMASHSRLIADSTLNKHTGLNFEEVYGFDFEYDCSDENNDCFNNDELDEELFKNFKSKENKEIDDSIFIKGLPNEFLDFYIENYTKEIQELHNIIISNGTAKDVMEVFSKLPKVKVIDFGLEEVKYILSNGEDIDLTFIILAFAIFSQTGYVKNDVDLLCEEYRKLVKTTGKGK